MFRYPENGTPKWPDRDYWRGFGKAIPLDDIDADGPEKLVDIRGKRAATRDAAPEIGPELHPDLAKYKDAAKRLKRQEQKPGHEAEMAPITRHVRLNIGARPVTARPRRESRIATLTKKLECDPDDAASLAHEPEDAIVYRFPDARNRRHDLRVHLRKIGQRTLPTGLEYTIAVAPLRITYSHRRSK